MVSPDFNPSYFLLILDFLLKTKAQEDFSLFWGGEKKSRTKQKQSHVYLANRVWTLQLNFNKHKISKKNTHTHGQATQNNEYPQIPVSQLHNEQQLAPSHHHELKYKYVEQRQ